MLLAGYEIAYEPQAVVRHSHAYTVTTALKRFFAALPQIVAMVESGARRAPIAQLRHLTVQPTGGVSATGGPSPASAASISSMYVIASS